MTGIERVESLRSDRLAHLETLELVGHSHLTSIGVTAEQADAKRGFAAN
jgi:hypothetical protein